MKPLLPLQELTPDGSAQMSMPACCNGGVLVTATLTDGGHTGRGTP